MRRLLAVTLVLIFMPMTLFAGSPIKNWIDIPVPVRPDGSRFTLNEVRAGIIRGSQTPLWTAEIGPDNEIRANLNVKNKHFAVVEIPYSESAYSIIYVSSDNLDYNPKRQTIHRNYAKWVLRLTNSINNQLRALSAMAEPIDSMGEAKSTSREDLFEELLKLDDLRDRGILTDEEFDREKRKLLEKN